MIIVDIYKLTKLLEMEFGRNSLRLEGKCDKIMLLNKAKINGNMATIEDERKFFSELADVLSEESCPSCTIQRVVTYFVYNYDELCNAPFNLQNDINKQTTEIMDRLNITCDCHSYGCGACWRVKNERGMLEELLVNVAHIAIRRRITNKNVAFIKKGE